MSVGSLRVCAVLIFAVGCGDRPEPGPPQSEPVNAAPAGEQTKNAPKKVVVPKSPGAVTDVVEPAELVARYPTLAGLTESHQRLAVGALHLVPGACGPCADKSEHLARCAMRAPTPECANVPKLVDRAAARASGGLPLKGVMEGIHYPDIWTALPPGAPGKVRVDLVLSEDDPWKTDAMRAKAALEDRYGEAIDIRLSTPGGPIAKAIGVNATPTWAIAGYRMRGAQSAPALGRLIDRELKGKK